MVESEVTRHVDVHHVVGEKVALLLSHLLQHFLLLTEADDHLVQEPLSCLFTYYIIIFIIIIINIIVLNIVFII